MNNEKKNFNNDQIVKIFEYKSMTFNKKRDKLMNIYNEIFKSYKVNGYLLNSLIV